MSLFFSLQLFSTSSVFVTLKHFLTVCFRANFLHMSYKSHSISD